ncbi:MAG: hypothetical protein AAGA26_02025 [Pseudomonadota bacterium]
MSMCLERRLAAAVMRITAVLIMLALVARALALPLAAEARSGATPICAGGEITWVSISGPELDQPLKVTEPCPYLGLSTAPGETAPSLAMHAAPWVKCELLLRQSAVTSGVCPRSVRTRAPPPIS